MSNIDNIPQDYPDHLRDGAPDRPMAAAGFVRPLTMLPFEDLSPEGFEQLCFWLITKDHEKAGCRRFGRRGDQQDGIDIFAYSSDGDGKLHMFQCRRVEQMGPKGLSDAVEDLLRAQWANKIASFTIICREKQFTAGVIRKGMELEERLAKAGISFGYWDGEQLTSKLTPYPDIIRRFFSGEIVQEYCNEWMRRSLFVELYLKTIVDDRKAAKEALEALDVAAPDFDDNWGKPRVYGNGFHLENEWLHLSGFLPTASAVSASALILFKRQDLSGVSVAVSGETLTRLFKGGPNPLGTAPRQFIAGSFPAGGEQRFALDVGNVRVAVPSNGVRAAELAIDAFKNLLLERVRELEKGWGTVGRRRAPGCSRYVIGYIPIQVWGAMLDFARAHDRFQTEGKWSVFDASGSLLKIYTKDAEGLDDGYHALIYSSDRVGCLDLPFGHVALEWTPPSDRENYEVSPARWWPCEHAAQWIAHELLPAVMNWLYSKHGKRWGDFLNREAACRRYQEAVITQGFEFVDLIEPTLADRLAPDQLWQTIDALKAFLNSSDERANIVSAEVVAALYEAIAIAVPGAPPDAAHYIASSLNLQHSTLSKMVEDVRAKIDFGRRDGLPGGILGKLLSPLSATLRGREVQLTGKEYETVRAALLPLVEHHDRERALARYLKAAL